MEEVKPKKVKSEKPRKIYKPRWISIHTYPEEDSYKPPHL
jgi:hypothetical protein